MSGQFVLDSSLAISWCIANESADVTEEILDGLTRGDTAIAPPLWIWEINNALLQAERHHRLDPVTRHQQIARLQNLPIEIDDFARRRVWNEAIQLAQKHKLSVYDASYLEMALRHNLPLGSLDKDLRKAADKSGVRCLPVKFNNY